MNRKHSAIAVLLGMCMLMSLAQTVSAQPTRPGGWWNGRHIGYTPAHEKAEQGLPTPCVDCQCTHEMLTACDDCCGGTACDECPPMPGPKPPTHALWTSPLFYGRLEYLGWWTKGMRVPALLTTGPIDVDPEDAGVIGGEGTEVLAGSERFNESYRSGGRITFGRVIEPVCGRAIELSYFGLEEDSRSIGLSGDGFPVLARPFFNTVNGENDARLIAYPDLIQGNVAIISSTEFQTGEILFRETYMEMAGCRAEYFIGYRFARLDDLLQINESTRSLDGPTEGSTFDLVDQFEASNEFQGGQIGLSWTRQCHPCWSFDVTTLIALGNTRADVVIDGQTVATSAEGDSTVNDAGLLAQSTNIGTYRDDKFSGMAELRITARRRFTCCLSGTIGYDLLYWSDVLRAGEQIDTDINTTQIPPGTLDGEPAPLFPSRSTAFWAQGFNVGLEYRY